MALSQQFAVNQIRNELGNGSAGIFAVNGPPGTGKTTMLRDLIADVVVERASRLATLGHPREAFDRFLADEVQISDRYSAKLRTVNREFTGAEIVVATATNKAAENVTAQSRTASGHRAG